MRRFRQFIPMTILCLCVPVMATARADETVRRVPVPLSHPGQPATVEAQLFSGDITVEGHDSDEVLLEIVVKSGEEMEPSTGKGGMKRIPNTSVGLSVEESDNVVEIGDSWGSNIGDLRIRVPRRTSLSLKSIQGGTISVRGVTGELDLENINGPIEALDVSGSVVAHSTNGAIKVVLDSVTPGKAMSFVTFNGDVDVTFPPNLKATLRISAGAGEILTDFDFDLVPQKAEVAGEREGERYRVKLEQDVLASVGGGGPEMRFKTWQGRIYIRKP